MGEVEPIAFLHQCKPHIGFISARVMAEEIHICIYIYLVCVRGQGLSYGSISTYC